MNSALCPDDRIGDLLGAMNSDPEAGMRKLDQLLSGYPEDPRLHFLKGSMLAGREDYEGAKIEMRRAVDIAPDFAVARFQLGFLLLTSGQPYPAQEAWGPLYALPSEHFLRHFVNGLCHLIRDEFDETIRDLEKGIAANRENEPMNRDMQLIIDEVRAKLQDPRGGAVSSVDLLLQQAALKGTRH